MSQLIIPDKNYSALKQAAYQLASCTEQIFQEIDQQQTLSSIVSKIRSCQTLDSLINTTAVEIRDLLNADRVGIFQFQSATAYDQGKFVGEVVQEELASTLKEKVFDHCVGAQFAIYYSQGQVQAIDDILNADLSKSDIELLQQFAVRSMLIVPVHKNSVLWGLICIHQCNHSRIWQTPEIEVVDKIASHFGSALQVSEQFEQLRHQATLIAKLKAQEKSLERQKSLVKISNRIRKSFDFDEICNIATQEARKLLQCSRVAIYQFHHNWSGDFKFESYEDGWKALVGTVVEDTHLMETQGGRYATSDSLSVSDIYKENYTTCHIQLLEQFQAKAYVIVPIFQGEKLWGLFASFQNDGPREWEADEVELLNQIGEQIGIALGQLLFVQKIQEQSVKLQETLVHLEQSQEELIEKEKLAALGQLIAGVAHEINNPLGAIQASASNTQKALKDAFQELPVLNNRLNSDHQQLLFELIQRSIESEPFIASAESRAIKRGIIKSLKEQKIEDARGMADLLMDMGVYTDLEPLMPLITSEQGEWALAFAYNLTCATVNNNNILQAVERSSKIVFALKSYARADKNTTSQLTDIREGIETTLKIYHNKLKRKIRVVTNYAPSIPNINGYPDELIQIWTNLIHNSIQAMEEGGALKIQVQEHNNGLEVEIQDSGPGISEEVKEQMFNAFFTTKPIGKGSGLGLYICQKIINKHQGHISVQSQPGDTRFKVWLPLAV